jgi:hypothetical protein
MIIMAILGALYGFFKAMRDTLAHHFYTSIFARCKKPKWYKWFQSDWRDRPKHCFSPLWDGWHFSDFGVSLVTVLGVWKGCDKVVGIMIFAAAAGAVFWVLYKKIFLYAKSA